MAVNPTPFSAATLAPPRSIRRELYPLAGAGVAAIALFVYELQLRGILLLLLAACIVALGTLVLDPARHRAGGCGGLCRRRTHQSRHRHR